MPLSGRAFVTGGGRGIGESIARDLYGDYVAYVPYTIPGFALVKSVADIFDRHCEVKGIVLLQHGIFTVGGDARETYERMIEQDAIVGVTSNPSIFQKAMTAGSVYDEQFRDLAAQGLDAFDEGFVQSVSQAGEPDWLAAGCDDVLDYFLTIITNGRVTTDGVGAHSDLLAEFPYLGPPHSARHLVEAPTSRASTSRRNRKCYEEV